jgi:deazaflavin-dependent oxidoreductase (nitroreductase family)
VAKEFELTQGRRMANAIFRRMVGAGMGPKHVYVLTVKGRTTGRLHSTPVTLVEDDSGRYAVSAFGNRDWAKNARAAGEVELKRGGHTETVAVEELTGEEAASVLERYFQQVPTSRPYFEVQPGGSDRTAWIAEGTRHPVFRLRQR